MVVQVIQDDVLRTFKEAMSYLRVSRSTLYRLMWSGQLTGHKVGSTWRFYREDLCACVGRETAIALTPSAENGMFPTQDSHFEQEGEGMMSTKEYVLVGVSGNDQQFMQVRES